MVVGTNYGRWNKKPIIVGTILLVWNKINDFGEQNYD
jgi:hypothetical protein